MHRLSTEVSTSEETQTRSERREQTFDQNEAPRTGEQEPNEDSVTRANEQPVTRTRSRSSKDTFTQDQWKEAPPLVSCGAFRLRLAEDFVRATETREMF